MDKTGEELNPHPTIIGKQNKNKYMYRIIILKLYVICNRNKLDRHNIFLMVSGEWNNKGRKGAKALRIEIWEKKKERGVRDALFLFL